MTEKALETRKMFDNLKDMFVFIMDKISSLEEKIDQNNASLNQHINDEEGKLAEHSVILRIIVFLAGATTVAIIGYVVAYFFSK